MKNKILIKLREKNDFVSGQSLCDEFGVSRTAVWKAINQLKKEGYEIESVNNRGYRIIAAPNVLSEKEIRAHLLTKWMGRDICCFDVIGSTNTEIASLAQEGAREGQLAVADRQDTGKGRRGRAWKTPAGVAIAMSFLLRPQIGISKAPMITLVAALSVAAAIDEITDGSLSTRVGIKWPNDIVIDGKKVCGILTEMSCQMDYINHVVVGIGINVNNDNFPEEIYDIATSIKLTSGEEINRARLTALVCNHFEKYYEIFLQTGDLSKLMDEYNHRLVNLDQGVRVLDPCQEYEGISRGINSKGELIVIKKDTSEEVLVSSGEVSVRGIYGYV